MAQFKIGTQTYALNKELWDQAVPRWSDHTIVSNLESLGELEKCHNLGVLTCSDQDWNEILDAAKVCSFELESRRFFRSLGITMEVR